MVGFILNKTLSESGEVSRGICSTDANNYLTTVEEHHHVKDTNGTITGTGMDGLEKTPDNSAYASMNMWGFTPDVLQRGEQLSIDFLGDFSRYPPRDFGHNHPLRLPVSLGI